MKLPKILRKKSVFIGYDALPASERKRIVKKAVEGANKEQLETVKAYRDSRCHVHN